MINPTAEKTQNCAASRRPAAAAMLACGFTLCLGSFHSPLQAQALEKTAEPFEGSGWNISGDSSAMGGTQTLPDVAAELAAQSKFSLDFQADFSGKGFEFFRGGPSGPLAALLGL